MTKLKFFSTVGTTPQAVANALAGHLLKLDTMFQIDSVDCYFFVGSAPSNSFPNRTSSDISLVENDFQQNMKNLPKLKSLNLTLHTEKLLDIYEQNLVENVVLIVKYLNDLVETGDHIIFDITAGRKIMTGSALLSIGILRKKWPECSFQIAYLWLKYFTQEYLNRKLYELGFDAYESIITSLDDIDARIKELLQ